MQETVVNATVGGCHVYWELKWQYHEYMKRELEQINLGKFCPPPRSCTEALRAAMADYRLLHKASLLGNEQDADLMIEPLRSRNDGLVLVRRRRGKTTNNHTDLFSATITFDGPLEVVTVTHAAVSVSLQQLQNSYDEYRKQIDPAVLGRSLVDLLEHFHATCPRSAGGLYYLPEKYSEDFNQIVKIYENGERGMITVAHIVLDDSAKRSIQTAISEELTNSADKILEEMAAGDLGEKALENRSQKAQYLLEKATEYEQFLGVQLVQCRKLLDTAVMATSSTVAIQEDNDVFDSMFTS